MATGGGIEVDNRTTCSVCLEPYRGRGAKILPCFHTFCVPCLAGLVKRTGGTSQTSDTPGLDGEEGEGGSADNLTCPTCRRVIPVPAGGVTAFQSNFYLNSSGGGEDNQPVPCTLCDGDQTAQFHCSQCTNSFCSLCRRAHDKFCRGSQVRSLQDPPNSSSTAQSPSHCQVRLQLQQVEDALKKLTEEEGKLNQEREAMDDSISVRYATLLRLAAYARITCCLSLGEVCDGLTERLHSSMAEARQTRDTLQQQLSSSQPAPVTASQLRAALFMEGELPMILNRDLGSSSLLQYHMEENASLMVDALQSFMGKVVRSNPSSGPAQNKAPSGSSPCFQDGHGAMSSAEAANPRNFQDLYKKLEDVAGQVTSLQSSHTLLSNAHSKLSTEHSALQREVTAMRDKHAIVHQDLAVLTAEKDKASAELAKLQRDVTFMQTDTPSTMLQTDIRQLKADQWDITAKLSSVQSDITALQGDNNNMKKDITALQGDSNNMKKDFTALQGDSNNMKKDITALQGDNNNMKKDITALQGDNNNMKKDITALQGDNNKMKKDCDQLKTDVTNTQGKLSHLESRFVTANTQVGFTAWLSEGVITNEEQTLVCDDIGSNEGGGYDAETGQFTAPVTGTYCFLATTSPCESDVEKEARLEIVVDGEIAGSVYSEGSSWSTGHTVVKLTSGQTVWLGLYADGEDMFCGCGTHFSGMLLQAEV